MSSKSFKTDQPPLQVKSYDSFQEFYDDIPIEGSLGILAYGASAVLAWKQKRAEAGWVPPKPVPEKPRKKKQPKETPGDMKKEIPGDKEKETSGDKKND